MKRERSSDAANASRSFKIGAQLVELDEQRIWHLRKTYGIVLAGLSEVLDTPQLYGTFPFVDALMSERSGGEALDMELLVEDLSSPEFEQRAFWPQAPSLGRRLEYALTSDNKAAAEAIFRELESKRTATDADASALRDEITTFREALLEMSQSSAFADRLIEWSEAGGLARTELFARNLASMFPAVGDRLRSMTRGRVDFDTPTKRMLETSARPVHNSLIASTVYFVADDDVAARTAGVVLARALRAATNDEVDVRETLEGVVRGLGSSSLPRTESAREAITQSDLDVFGIERTTRSREVDGLPESPGAIADKNLRVHLKTADQLERLDVALADLLRSPQRLQQLTTHINTSVDTQFLAATLAFLPKARELLEAHQSSLEDDQQPIEVPSRDSAVPVLLGRNGLVPTPASIRKTDPYTPAYVSSEMVAEKVDTKLRAVEASELLKLEDATLEHLTSVRLTRVLASFAAANPAEWQKLCTSAYRSQPSLSDAAIRLLDNVHVHLEAMRDGATSPALSSDQSTTFPEQLKSRETLRRTFERRDGAAQMVIVSGYEVAAESADVSTWAQSREEKAFLGLALTDSRNDGLYETIVEWIESHVPEADRAVIDDELAESAFVAERLKSRLALLPTVPLPSHSGTTQRAESLMIASQRLDKYESYLRARVWSMAMLRDVVVAESPGVGWKIDQATARSAEVREVAEFVDGSRPAPWTSSIDVQTMLDGGHPMYRIEREIRRRTWQAARLRQDIDHTVDVFDAVISEALAKEPTTSRRLRTHLYHADETSSPGTTSEALACRRALEWHPLIQRQLQLSVLRDQKNTIEGNRVLDAFLDVFARVNSSPAITAFLKDATSRDDVIGDRLVSVWTREQSWPEQPEDVDDIITFLDNAPGATVPPHWAERYARFEQREKDMVRVYAAVNERIGSLLEADPAAAIALDRVILELPDDSLVDQSTVVRAIRSMSKCDAAMRRAVEMDPTELFLASEIGYKSPEVGIETGAQESPSDDLPSTDQDDSRINSSPTPSTPHAASSAEVFRASKRDETGTNLPRGTSDMPTVDANDIGARMPTNVSRAPASNEMVEPLSDVHITSPNSGADADVQAQATPRPPLRQFTGPASRHRRPVRRGAAVHLTGDTASSAPEEAGHGEMKTSSFLLARNAEQATTGPPSAGSPGRGESEVVFESEFNVDQPSVSETDHNGGPTLA